MVTITVATKSGDLFQGCLSPGFIFVYILIILAIFTPNPFDGYLYVAFFFILGGLCLYNFRGCGRYHCQITGPGAIVFGVIALLKVMGIIAISWGWIWGGFLIMVVVAYGVEAHYRSGSGTCYTPRKKRRGR